MRTGALLVVGCVVFAALVQAVQLPSHDVDQALGMASFAQADAKLKNSLPLSGKLFVALAATFVLVTVVIYAVQQYRYYSKTVLKDVFAQPEKEGQEEEEPSLFDKVFNETSLGNARNAMSFTPVVSVLMLYCMFRAVAQDLDRKGSDYRTLQLGMVFATVGILVQALDGFSIRLHSDVFGNLSESLGSIATYIGYAILVWGVFEVRRDAIPLSVASQGIAALALLLIGSMLVIKLLQLKQRYVDSRSPVKLDALDSVLNEGMMEEVRQTASFAPFLMIVFFYTNFLYLAAGSLPAAAEIGIKGCVIGIYTQACGVVLKSCLATFGSIVRAIAILATYGFFFTAMYVLVDEGFPASSVALTNVLLLLFVMAILKVAIVEFSQYLKVPGESDEVNSQRIAALSKLFKDMMATAGLGEIVCVLLLFVHYRAALLLDKSDVDGYIDNQHGLKQLIFLATSSIILQMAVLLVEAGVGSNKAFSVLVALGILGVNVALIGILAAVLQ